MVLLAGGRYALLGATPSPAPPSQAPQPAQAEGFNTNTFNSVYVGNTPGQMYGPAGYFYYTGGIITNNADGTTTIDNGSNDPQISTCQRTSGKPNNWIGKAFGGGGYFETVCRWPPYVSGSTWPSGGAYPINVVANNNVSPTIGGVWAPTTITATSIQTTSAVIPAWRGNASVSGTATFHDGSTRAVTVSSGLTTLSWSNAIASQTNNTIVISYASNFRNYVEWDWFEADGKSATLIGIDGAINWWNSYDTQTKAHTDFGFINVANTGAYNTYGALWKPAGTTGGYLKWFLNNVQVNELTYLPYDPTLPPGASMTGTNGGHLWAASANFGIMDSMLYAPCFNTAAPTGAAPMTLKSFNVWQSSDANNLVQT